MADAPMPTAYLTTTIWHPGNLARHCASASLGLLAVTFHCSGLPELPAGL